MRNILYAISTLFYKNKRANEHDDVVDETIEVQKQCHLVHLLLQFVQLLGSILESECLVLVMNKTLPAPQWKDYLLLPSQFM
jgi:hypothetical protein